MPGAEPQTWELTFDDPDHLAALAALAPAVETLNAFASPDAPLAFGGPLIDSLRSYVDVATPNSLWVLAPTTSIAKAVSRSIREDGITVNRVAPLVFDLERAPARFRQAAARSNITAYECSTPAEFVGRDPYGRPTASLHDLQIVTDLPAIGMALARVDDRNARVLALEEGAAVSGIDPDRELALADAARDHALLLLSALPLENAAVDREAMTPDEHEDLTALLNVHVLDEPMTVSYEGEFGDVARSARMMAHSLVRELTVDQLRYQSTRRAVIGNHPLLARWKKDTLALAPVVPIEELRAMRAASQGFSPEGPGR
jgi:hypothetical protein